MANEEHVARLKQGAAVWNAWRLSVEEFMRRRNSSYADLAKEIFENLTDADLGARLEKLKLYEIDADLSGANLSGANLSGANLTDANLTGVEFV